MSSIHASTFTVTSTANTNVNGTLRDALINTNVANDNVTIDITTGGTLLLTSPDLLLPAILNNSSSKTLISIQGPLDPGGNPTFTINGNASRRGIMVTPTTSLTAKDGDEPSLTVFMTSLNITSAASVGGNGGHGGIGVVGYSAGGGGGAGLGGGLFVGTGAKVILSDVNFTACSASGGDGGDALDTTGMGGGGGGGGLDGGNAGNASGSSPDPGYGAGGGGGGFGGNGAASSLGSGGGGGGGFGHNAEATFGDGRGSNGGPYNPDLGGNDTEGGPGGASGSFDGNGGDGSDGNPGGGGGGGGQGGGNDSRGGNGGAGGFGGGGGGGGAGEPETGNTSYGAPGGAGGFGGGGGGGSDLGVPGGDGGFGGGSGGAGAGGPVTSGTPGFGGGQGGRSEGADGAHGGDGGSGYGGAIFVQDGGTLEIVKVTFNGSVVTAGSGGASPLQGGAAGNANGADIYLHGSANITFSITDDLTLMNPIGVNSGGVNSTGTFLKQGTGTLTLDASDFPFYGNMQVSVGTLSISNSLPNLASLENNATIDIQGPLTLSNLSGFTSGVINLNDYDVTVTNSVATSYDGIFAGTGRFIKGGTETLTLSQDFSSDLQVDEGTVTFKSITGLGENGAIRLNGGTLNVGDISTIAKPISVLSGSSVLTIPTDTITQATGGFTGSGTLTKTGKGTLTITDVAHTFNGSMNVSAGKLILGSDVILNGDINIATGSTADVEGSATVNTLSVSGGTLTVGTTLTVNQTLNLDSNSTVNLVMTPNNNSSILVEGTANLNQASLVLNTTPGDYAVGTTYTLLQAPTLNGQFGSITSSLLGLDLRPTYTSTALQVTIISPQPQRLDPSIYRGNNATIAGYINSLFEENIEFRQLANTIFFLSREDQNLALNMISPTRNTFSSEASNQLGLTLSNLISSYTHDSKTLSTLGASLSGSLHDVRHMYAAATKKLMPNFVDEGPSMFALPFATWTDGKPDYENTQDFPYRSQSYGFLVGYDSQASTQSRMGACIGFAQTSLKGAYARLIQSSTKHLIAGTFINTQTGGLVLDCSLWGAYATTQHERKINIGDAYNYTAYSDPEGYQLTPHVQASYIIDLPQKVSFEPFVSFDYAMYLQKAYTEMNASFLSMHQDKQFSGVRRFGVGVYAYEEISSYLFLRQKLAASRDSPINLSTFNGSFINVPTSFTTEDFRSTHWTAQPSLEMIFKNKSYIDFTIGYQGEFNHSFSSHQLSFEIAKLF